MTILIISKIMKIRVSRKAHFNSAHRLANLSWTKEKNLKVFGKCSYDNYHGHNYELIVKLTGEIDPETGMLMDLSILNYPIHNNSIGIEGYFYNYQINEEINTELTYLPIKWTNYLVKNKYGKDI